MHLASGNSWICEDVITPAEQCLQVRLFNTHMSVECIFVIDFFIEPIPPLRWCRFTALPAECLVTKDGGWFTMRCICSGICITSSRWVLRLTMPFIKGNLFPRYRVMKQSDAMYVCITNRLLLLNTVTLQCHCLLSSSPVTKVCLSAWLLLYCQFPCPGFFQKHLRPVPVLHWKSCS